MSEEERRVAIIGKSLSGKTFRAIGYSRGLWRTRHLRSLVFDPYKRKNNWGAQAWVSDNFAEWARVVSTVKNCVVIWDETTHNGGREKENEKLFTAIRHDHPVLIAIGHGYQSLLPMMRENLSDLVIGLASKKQADEWAEIMVDPEIYQATTLKKYQWLHKKPYEPVKIHTETAAEVLAGLPL